MRGRVKKNFFLTQWVWLRRSGLKNEKYLPSFGKKPSTSGFDRKYVGDAEIWERYRLLRVRFTLLSVWSLFIFGCYVIFQFTLGSPDDSGHSWHSKPRPFWSSSLKLYPRNIFCKKISSVYRLLAHKGDGHKIQNCPTGRKCWEKSVLLDIISPFFRQIFIVLLDINKCNIN